MHQVRLHGAVSSSLLPQTRARALTRVVVGRGSACDTGNASSSGLSGVVGRTSVAATAAIGLATALTLIRVGRAGELVVDARAADAAAAARMEGESNALDLRWLGGATARAVARCRAGVVPCGTAVALVGVALARTTTRGDADDVDDVEDAEGARATARATTRVGAGAGAGARPGTVTTARATARAGAGSDAGAAAGATAAAAAAATATGACGASASSCTDTTCDAAAGSGAAIPRVAQYWDSC